jgi:hypothetical protein
MRSLLTSRARIPRPPASGRAPGLRGDHPSRVAPAGRDAGGSPRCRIFTTRSTTGLKRSASWTARSRGAPSGFGFGSSSRIDERRISHSWRVDPLPARTSCRGPQPILNRLRSAPFPPHRAAQEIAMCPWRLRPAVRPTLSAPGRWGDRRSRPLDRGSRAWGSVKGRDGCPRARSPVGDAVTGRHV